jgi:hypothetical protein
MSTHFTRRGGAPADSRDQSPETTRERRFRRDDPDDVPVSPLVAEQQDAALRAGAPRSATAAPRAAPAGPPAGARPSPPSAASTSSPGFG